MLQLKRSSGGAHCGALTRRATPIQEAGVPQATLESPFDPRKELSELDTQTEQLTEDNDDIEADVEDAADELMAAKVSVKWCQASIK